MAIVRNSRSIEQRPLSHGRFEYAKISTGWKQKPVSDPFLPLSYQLALGNVIQNDLIGSNTALYCAWNTQWTGSDSSWIADVTGSLANSSNRMKLAYNRAYAKCMEQQKAGSADLIAFYLERVKSAQMIQDRFTQILNVANAAQGRSIKKLAQSLGTTPADLRRRHKKSTGFLSTPSSTFIEVSWGWLPMLQDAFNALAYLGNDIPPMRCQGVGSYDLTVESNKVVPGSSINNYSLGGKVLVKVGLTCSLSSVLQTEIARLGLTNPGASAYQVISYSWLLDWFSSVGEVIEGWDDSIVLKYERPFITRYGRVVERQHFEEGIYNPALRRGCKYLRVSVRMNRETPSSLPGPMLAYHEDPFSPQRLLIVCALLITRFKSFKSAPKLL